MNESQKLKIEVLTGSPIDANSTVLVDCLVMVGRALLADGYHFTAITPATHARVLARPRVAMQMTDVFGWNRPFTSDLLPLPLFTSLKQAGLLTRQDGKWISRIRYASVGNSIYAHGAFPTLERDAVFFGPDTYRFITVLRGLVPRCGVLVDVGCGSGAGALAMRERADRLILTDINDRALHFAQANARLAELPDTDIRSSDVLANVHEQPDVIIANPPYLADTRGRAYRDGGGRIGTGLAVKIVDESLRRLKAGGRLVLYTGSPIVNGTDLFFDQIRPLLHQTDATVSYEEIDPDVFGEELDEESYADVERIAAVVLCLTMSSNPNPRNVHVPSPLVG